MTEKFYDIFDDDNFYDMTEQEGMRRIGAAIQGALDEVKPDTVNRSLSLTKKGSDWVVDEYSYKSVSNAILGYDFDKKAPSNVI